MFDSIGFDLDGTIWDSMNCTTGAWKTVSERHGKKIPTKSDLGSVMGLNRFDLMKKLFPDMDEAEAYRFFDEATVECVREIRAHGGILYDGVEPTLAQLSKHFKLYIVSNCQQSYMNAFLDFHGLGKYFCDFAFEDAQTICKGDNIKKLLARNGLSNTVYIGDTQGDCNAAKFAAVPFAYAAYGFGSVDSYDYKFDSFKDIINLI